MEGEFVQNQVAGEAPGRARVGGEDLDAAPLAGDLDAAFDPHVFDQRAGGQVLLFKRDAEQRANLRAFADELRAVVAAVGEHGDEPPRPGEQPVNRPRREHVALADLAAPMQGQQPGLGPEDRFLKRAELNEWRHGRQKAETIVRCN